MSNTFAIWSEAYAASPAPKQLGNGTGDTFEEACLEWATRTLSTQWFNKSTLSYGGIKLHNSRISAEKRKKK